MARTLTRAEANAWLKDTGRDILRTYSVTVNLVLRVDNQGAQCEYCGNAGARVKANVYVTEWNGDTQCADTCLGCLVNVVDGHFDTNPELPVTVEIAQGA